MSLFVIGRSVCLVQMVLNRLAAVAKRNMFRGVTGKSDVFLFLFLRLSVCFEGGPFSGRPMRGGGPFGGASIASDYLPEGRA